MLLVSADDCHVNFLFVVIHETSVLLVKVGLLLHNDWFTFYSVGSIFEYQEYINKNV